MLIKDKVPFRVLLPKSIWEDARSKEHFKQLLSEYMKISYPHYIVTMIEKPYALCERRD